MGRYEVETSEPAKREIQAALTWWGEHRPAAPHLLHVELRRAIQLVGALPRCGALIRLRPREVRRVLLQRTRYRLEYRIDSDEQITLLRLVHMHRREK